MASTNPCGRSWTKYPSDCVPVQVLSYVHWMLFSSSFFFSFFKS